MPPKRAARRTYHASQYHDDDRSLDDIRWKRGGYANARKKFKSTIAHNTAQETRHRLAILHWIITRPDAMEALAHVDGELHAKELMLKEQEDRAKGKHRVRWASLRAQGKEVAEGRKMITKVEKALMKYVPEDKLARLLDGWTGQARDHMVTAGLLSYFNAAHAEREPHPFGPVTPEMARDPNLVHSLAFDENEEYVRHLYRGRPGVSRGARPAHRPLSDEVYRDPDLYDWTNPEEGYLNSHFGIPALPAAFVKRRDEAQAREKVARDDPAWLAAKRRQELATPKPVNKRRPFMYGPDAAAILRDISDIEDEDDRAPPPREESDEDSEDESPLMSRPRPARNPAPFTDTLLVDGVLAEPASRVEEIDETMATQMDVPPRAPDPDVSSPPPRQVRRQPQFLLPVTDTQMPFYYDEDPYIAAATARNGGVRAIYDDRMDR